jgi:uncharacterized membrane protein YraQ (UPF0718 family)
MDFGAVEKVVSRYAPLLGSAISEYNPLAGIIIMGIAQEFDSKADPTSLVNAIQTDQNAQAKLHQLEIEHQDAILQANTKDVANARDREEKIVQITGKRDRILDALAVLVVIGFFGICIINYFFELEDDHVVVMLTGQISSALMMVLSYYFGSSNK